MYAIEFHQMEPNPVHVVFLDLKHTMDLEVWRLTKKVCSENISSDYLVSAW